MFEAQIAVEHPATRLADILQKGRVFVVKQVDKNRGRVHLEMESSTPHGHTAVPERGHRDASTSKSVHQSSAASSSSRSMVPDEWSLNSSASDPAKPSFMAWPDKALPAALQETKHKLSDKADRKLMLSALVSWAALAATRSRNWQSTRLRTRQAAKEAIRAVAGVWSGERGDAMYHISAYDWSCTREDGSGYRRFSFQWDDVSGCVCWGSSYWFDASDLGKDPNTLTWYRTNDCEKRKRVFVWHRIDHK